MITTYPCYKITEHTRVEHFCFKNLRGTVSRMIRLIDGRYVLSRVNRRSRRKYNTVCVLHSAIKIGDSFSHKAGPALGKPGWCKRAAEKRRKRLGDRLWQ